MGKRTKGVKLNFQKKISFYWANKIKGSLGPPNRMIFFTFAKQGLPHPTPTSFGDCDRLEKPFQLNVRGGKKFGGEDDLEVG